MACYPVKCAACGLLEDQVHPMPPAGGPPRFDPCACGGAVTRVVTPVNEVGTGNRMHHILDSTLRPGFEPTRFNTRAEWEGEMKRLNCRPMEPGDGARQVQNEREHKRRGDENFRVHQEQRIDVAIEKSIAQIGGA